MNYYEEIKSKLIDDEVFAKVKDYSKERHRVTTYFEIGKILTEVGGKYGDNIIGEYSKRLVVEVGKRYNKKTLFKMKQLYNLFINEKVVPMVRQLSWSNCLLLIPLKDIDKINYYIKQAIDRNLTKRELQEIIKNNEYERLPSVTKRKLIENQDLKVNDLIPNPIIIKNSSNYEIITEKIMQKLILEDISSFLKELGIGFTYVDSEYKIKLGSRNNFIDLLLFNIIYNCYIVIELKVTELKKEHIGQLQVYMNYIDENLKTINQDKTIGIIICKQENEYVIKYCSDKRIISRKYKII